MLQKYIVAEVQPDVHQFAEYHHRSKIFLPCILHFTKKSSYNRYKSISKMPGHNSTYTNPSTHQGISGDGLINRFVNYRHSRSSLKLTSKAGALLVVGRVEVVQDLALRVGKMLFCESRPSVSKVRCSKAADNKNSAHCRQTHLRAMAVLRLLGFVSRRKRLI